MTDKKENDVSTNAQARRPTDARQHITASLPECKRILSQRAQAILSPRFAKEALDAKTPHRKITVEILTQGSGPKIRKKREKEPSFSLRFSLRAQALREPVAAKGDVAPAYRFFFEGAAPLVDSAFFEDFASAGDFSDASPF